VRGETVHLDVDRAICVSSGQCAFAVPDVFDQDDDNGRVVLLDADPPQELHHAVAEAAHRCPVRAISLVSSDRHIHSGR
jgi:ferredoxin